MLATCIGMLVFGVGVLFVDYGSLPLRILIAIALVVWGSVGLYFMFKTDKLDFAIMAKQKVSLALVLRSAVMTAGALYLAWMTYGMFGLKHPFTLMFMALAVGAVVLLPYHYLLYYQQNKPE